MVDAIAVMVFLELTVLRQDGGCMVVMVCWS